MRFIDCLRRDPMCFDGDTNKIDFDASPFLRETTTFDVTEIAAQLIEATHEVLGVGRETIFTETGKDLFKYQWEQYTGIIPPFDNCFFEYRATKEEQIDPTITTRVGDVAVHLVSLSKETIESRFPDQGFAFVMHGTVFFRSILENGKSRTSRETVCLIASDSGGQVKRVAVERCLPPGADRSALENLPLQTPIIVVLISIMMLNRQLVKKASPPERVLNRGGFTGPSSSVDPPVDRYYTLALNTDRVRIDNGNRQGKGGWTQALHEVRAFFRHMKSGKVVPVRSHLRGDPDKGVIEKDYKMKSATAHPGSPTSRSTPPPV